jgi:hypothetical protein
VSGVESEAVPTEGAPARAPESGIVVRIRVPAAIERIRSLHDSSAALGMAAHVTVLYPFVAPARLDASVRATVARIVARQPAFDVTLLATRRLPGVLWLDPVPAQPFRQLTRAIWAAFPDHPPYGGAFPEIIPHLTLAESEDAGLVSRLERSVASLLPIAAKVTHVEVASTVSNGRWRLRWRLPLGDATPGR